MSIIVKTLHIKINSIYKVKKTVRPIGVQFSCLVIIVIKLDIVCINLTKTGQNVIILKSLYRISRIFCIWKR